MAQFFSAGRRRKWHSTQSLVCISQESHNNIHAVVYMQKCGSMKWKKLKSQCILWPYKVLIDEFFLFQTQSVRLHMGGLDFLAECKTAVIIIFIISSMSTHGTAALHPYSCFTCWCPASMKLTTTVPLPTSHTDVLVQVTLVSKCPLEVPDVQTKGKMGAGR